MSNSKKNKMFLATCQDGRYVYVFSKNLNDAKEKILELYGKELYDEIDWTNVISGKQAEEIEELYRSMANG